MAQGVVVVHKPTGLTSHDVVARLRRIFKTKRVGHTGTLDPLATGVLVICLGQATRIVEYLTADIKVYRAEMTFGLVTDSQDITGTVLAESDASQITESMVTAVLLEFRGSILQIPPMVSAVHYEGRRLYELAREGKVVERTPRPITVHSIEMHDFVAGSRATCVLEIVCSSGTYIRTLCHDLGERLGTGGTMTSLVRTRAGAFSLDEAFTLETLSELENPASVLRSIPEALDSMPSLVIADAEVTRIRMGQAIRAEDANGGSPVLLLDSFGEAVAIAERREGAHLAPIKVFVHE